LLHHVVCIESGVKRIGNDFVVTKDGKLNDNELSEDLFELINDYRTIQFDAFYCYRINSTLWKYVNKHNKLH